MSEEDWKNLALWLADCQAATAYDIGSRKSSSKADKRRHASICQKTAEMIQMGNFMERPSQISNVLNRLKSSTNECKK